MRIYDNGIYRDATPEEIDAINTAAEEAKHTEPTTEEKLAALMAAIEGGLSNG